MSTTAMLYFDAFAPAGFGGLRWAAESDRPNVDSAAATSRTVSDENRLAIEKRFHVSTPCCKGGHP